MSFDGGYYMLKQNLVRGGFINGHTADDGPDAISDIALRAINAVQAVPWRINGWILDIQRECWVSGSYLGGLPQAEDHKLPERLSDEEWEAMGPKERSEHKYQIMKIHDENASLVGHREAFIRRLEMSESLRDHESIWFPHFFDFRTRMYPIPQDLHPQTDDLTKALLMFARGKRLGEEGLYWLAVKLAGCAGKDKMQFDDRVAWVKEHHDLIVDSGLDPLDGRRFWASFEDDEPWGFLAAAREWALAHQLDNPADFVSHQPVPLDGSVNGIQHLSLMGRDQKGALASNCSSAKERHDLYTAVATEVQKLVAADAAAGVPEAVAWLTKGISRSTVKRAVMTTPYGVTQRGIQDQLIKDGHCKEVEGKAMANAKYLKDQIIVALETTAESAKVIMAWFQECAGVLAKAEIPLVWHTPSGCRVTQSYYKTVSKQIKTLQGMLRIQEEDKSCGLAVNKQMLASAPNIIHSFDAAMLQMTVCRMLDHGFEDFAMIHDSYGVHACDAPILARTLREVAVDIYREDWLLRLEQEFHAALPSGEFPARPPLGSFNVEEVLDSPFFFS